MSGSRWSICLLNLCTDPFNGQMNIHLSAVFVNSTEVAGKDMVLHPIISESGHHNDVVTQDFDA